MCHTALLGQSELTERGRGSYESTLAVLNNPVVRVDNLGGGLYNPPNYRRFFAFNVFLTPVDKSPR